MKEAIQFPHGLLMVVKEHDLYVSGPIVDNTFKYLGKKMRTCTKQEERKRCKLQICSIQERRRWLQNGGQNGGPREIESCER